MSEMPITNTNGATAVIGLSELITLIDWSTAEIK